MPLTPRLRNVVLVLVAVGVAFRLAYFFLGATLSTDEAQLALNLVHRSYGGILDPLDFNQAAPPAFLLAEKSVLSVFGVSDLALRLVPLVASIISVVCFFPVAVRLIGPRAAAVALALFAMSPLAIFYAATTKQYATDVVVALVLYALIESVRGRLVPREAVALAVAGGVAVWLSNPAAFVEAGIGVVLLAKYALEREWRRLVTLALVCTSWLASFLLSYGLTQANYAHLQHSISGSGAVFGTSGSPGRTRAWVGTLRAALGVPHFTAQLRDVLLVLAVALAVGGFFVLCRQNRTIACMLAAPAAIALAASAAGKYPFFPRTMLFTVPALLAFVAVGAVACARPLRSRSAPALVVVLVLPLVVSSGVAVVNHVRIRDGTELKRVLALVADDARPGDSLYVYPDAQYDVRYYLECRCFGDARVAKKVAALWPPVPAAGGQSQSAPALRSTPPRLVVGRFAGTYARDFRPLRGRPRVWVVVAAAPAASSASLLAYLDRIGLRRRLFAPRGSIAVAALYDLKR